MIHRLMIVTATAVIALLGASQPAAGQTVADPLLAGFQDPPQSARPRVWWHWMNGNITEDGIAKDLAWMKRIGIGGMHNFDASLYTPQVVENRLVYMTPEWKQAFRFAASQADEHGLELGIAGSPGWSETGGPWVPPENAIKKVVWSETMIQGGQRLQGPLAAPPMVSGPYLSLQAEEALGLARDGGEPPQAYGDIAVLAVPMDSAEDSGAAEYRNGQGDLLDANLFSDHDLVQTVDIGTGSPQQAAVLQL
ncbi:MAG TPA: glycosyl hydrolase, partial [Xanthomonadales bacterium]|nr:glycosyl hydrolase [Xanthomonadales bacterium]